MEKISLECRSITKIFKSRSENKTVLYDASFDAFKGEVTLIKGKSGAGKTVLQWMLAGLDNPDSGSIIIDGVEINRLSAGELAIFRNKNIGIIFQNFNLVSSWTALENITAALINSGFSKKSKITMARELLDKLGITECSEKLPKEMSLGQEQRVAIARTLISSPGLILADEPTGGVDPETGEKIIDLVLSYIKSNNAGLIVTTHGNFPKSRADKIYKLESSNLIKMRPAKRFS